MAYTFDEPRAGLLQIANTDAGTSTAGGTTIPTPPAVLGTIVRAFDPTYGAGNSYTQAGTPTAVLSNTAGNWRFDNINVTGILVSAVPEPQTYLMWLAGLGMLMLSVRRRQR